MDEMLALRTNLSGLVKRKRGKTMEVGHLLCVIGKKKVREVHLDPGYYSCVNNRVCCPQSGQSGV